MGMSRSEQMARVHGSDTRPELRIRRALWSRGWRYRIGLKTPGGRPDLAFTRQRVAVFIDGCFWHGCPIHYVRPRTSEEFWQGKLRANFDRDRRQLRALVAAGWYVLRIWEHDAEADRLRSTCARIERALEGEREDQALHRVVSVRPIGPAGLDLERREIEDLADEGFREVFEGPRNSRSGPSARRRGKSLGPRRDR